MNANEGSNGNNHSYSSANIMLDESGDLGFSPHSSRHFVVAATITYDPDAIDRLAKRVRNKSMRREWREELKFNNLEEPTRILMLNGVAKMNCQIIWISFDKGRIPLSLREDKYLLYRMACEIVLREAVRRTPAKKVHVIIDKRYSKKRDRDRLDQHLMSIITENHAGNFLPKVQISQYDSFMSSELQVHDFVVGAIYQHLERDVDEYMNLIKSKIVFGQRGGNKNGSP